MSCLQKGCANVVQKGLTFTCIHGIPCTSRCWFLYNVLLKLTRPSPIGYSLAPKYNPTHKVIHTHTYLSCPALSCPIAGLIQSCYPHNEEPSVKMTNFSMKAIVGTYILLGFLSWQTISDRLSLSLTHTYTYTHTRFIPTSSIPTLSIPISSIPIWSMLTKWELTKWEVDKVGTFFSFIDQ